jgi:hypothetical protein
VRATSVLVLSCCGIMACSVSGDGHYTVDEPARYKDAVSWAVIAINLLYMAIGVGTLLVCALRNYARWRERHGAHQRSCLAILGESAGGWLKALIGVSSFGRKHDVHSV